MEINTKPIAAVRLAIGGIKLMSNVALVPPPKAGPLFDETYNAKEKIESTHTSELVIALCGPIGSPLHEVAEVIHTILDEKFDYEKCEVVRLSELIEEHAGKVPVSNAYARTNALIERGNQLRKDYGPSVLAELAIHKIRLEREAFKKEQLTERHEPRRICHIIDSIKNQEELEVLRTVYGDMLYVFGVFAPLDRRDSNLRKRGMEPHEIYTLIDRDSGEESKTGQTVRNTFPQSDFFLRIDSGTDAQLAQRVERFLHLILGTKILTPTSAETAMYAAASAASNSACLSRQVGASITDPNGFLLAVGWNDVPKPGGGLYNSDPHDPTSEKDKRCWNRGGGKCFNDEEKDLLAKFVAEGLSKEGFFPEDVVERATKSIVANQKLRNLIEFSRSIHAEMHALMNSMRINGERMVKGKMFVTTYPCHACARHIVASGIMEVYYIEPYRKSLATKLHDDAVSESDRDMNLVRILPYDGVAPAKYLSLFRMKPDSRKKNGKMIRIAPSAAEPVLQKSMEALPTLEGIVVKGLVKKKLVKDEGGPA
jgi:deoxycytidylate deaminase